MSVNGYLHQAKEVKMADTISVAEAMASVDAFLKEAVDKRVCSGVDIVTSDVSPEQGYSWTVTVTAQPGTALYDYLKDQPPADPLFP